MEYIEILLIRFSSFLMNQNLGSSSLIAEIMHLPEQAVVCVSYK